MTSEACENCKFWAREIKEHYGSDDFVSECNRFPPSLGEINNISPYETTIHLAQWPMTLGDSWCGEYVMRSNDLAKPPGAALCDRSA